MCIRDRPRDPLLSQPRVGRGGPVRGYLPTYQSVSRCAHARALVQAASGSASLGIPIVSCRVQPRAARVPSRSAQPVPRCSVRGPIHTRTRHVACAVRCGESVHRGQTDDLVPSASLTIFMHTHMSQHSHIRCIANTVLSFSHTSRTVAEPDTRQIQ